MKIPEYYWINSPLWDSYGHKYCYLCGEALVEVEERLKYFDTVTGNPKRKVAFACPNFVPRPWWNFWKEQHAVYVNEL